MSADTVAASEVAEEPMAIEQPEMVEQPAEMEAEAPPKEVQVPLTALQKERSKRQEAEQELKWYREQMMRQQQAQPQEPDESHLEAATREDLGKAEQKIVRKVIERSWIQQNPEKAAEVNEKLAEFLKQRPNLAAAIESAENRYEEAWILMDALTPKQKLALKPVTQKKEAPGNPSSVPKAAGMNESVDCMSMTDAEFNAYRQSKRRRR